MESASRTMLRRLGSGVRPGAARASSGSSPVSLDRVGFDELVAMARRGSIDSGRSLDIALDTDFDTISILYELTINTFTLDDFVVAEVGFPFDLNSDTLFNPGDVNRAEVSLSLSFATKNPPITPVPLPASAWLLFAAILGLAGFQRLAKRP